MTILHLSICENIHVLCSETMEKVVGVNAATSKNYSNLNLLGERDSLTTWFRAGSAADGGEACALTRMFWFSSKQDEHHMVLSTHLQAAKDHISAWEGIKHSNVKSELYLSHTYLQLSWNCQNKSVVGCSPVSCSAVKTWAALNHPLTPGSIFSTGRFSPSQDQWMLRWRLG